MEGYEMLRFSKRIGRSEVQQYKHLETGIYVAVKWIPFENKSGGLPYEVLREISVLKELKHVNIIRLLDVVYEEDGFGLVFEDMWFDLAQFFNEHPNTIMYPYQRKLLEVMHEEERFGLEFEDMWVDLAQFIEEHPNTTIYPDLRKSFLFQILQGISYCHCQNVLHRDLQPQNLLVNIFSHTVKLADFGCTRTFDVPLPKYSVEIADYGYRAPEALISGQYSSGVDMWAVGCIFAEMVTSKPLFDGKSEIEMLIQIFRMFGLPDDRDWPEFFKMFDLKEEIPSGPRGDLADKFPGLEPEGLDLLSKMLCVDPKSRITALDALKHPYFTNLDVGSIAKV